jgi:hypothetical protein
MADITFSWMLDQISNHVSINKNAIYQDATARQRHIGELNDESRKYDLMVAQGKKEAAESTWGQWTQHMLSSAASTVMHPLTKPKRPNTKRHDMGWGTGTIVDSYTTMYHMNGSKPRTPDRYDKGTEITKEEVHPTVGYRYKMFKRLAQKLGDDKLLYLPAGLTEQRSFDRKLDTVKGRWEYVFAEGIVLPEYRIRKDGFERHALANGWDTRQRDSDGKPLTRETTAKWMRRLDVQNGINSDDQMVLSDEGSSDEDGNYHRE